jgi:hypothetical protein
MSTRMTTAVSSKVIDVGPRVISRRVLKLGLETYAHVVKEFNEAKQGWSKGTLYVCPFCDKDFWSPSGARKHMKTRGHPVLRWDWYDAEVLRP